MQKIQTETTYFDVLKSVITKAKIEEESIKNHLVPLKTIRWLHGLFISKIRNTIRAKYSQEY